MATRPIVSNAFDLQHKVPLGPRTTLELGGPARYFARVTNVGQLRAAYAWSVQNKVRTLILGSGSNIVVSDEGFDGLAIELDLRRLEFGSADDPAIVRVGAGEIWDDLVQQAVQRGLGGIECLSGIPGHVGATPIQNVGAYGQEVADVITEVDVLETRTGTTKTLSADACRFRYRASRFKDEPEAHVVIGVTFRLEVGGAPTLRYPELARAVGSSASLAETRDVVISLRRGKSMVLDANDPNRRSVGSFFTNPIVPGALADVVVQKAVARGLVERESDVPCYPAADGDAKLSAAWLIERSGITRGYRRGSVGISSAHTLALVHHGGGTTKQLLELAGFVRDRVLEEFGIRLEPEPRLVGVSLPE